MISSYFLYGSEARVGVDAIAHIDRLPEDHADLIHHADALLCCLAHTSMRARACSSHACVGTTGFDQIIVAPT